MIQRYRLHPFSIEYIEPACRLFIENYKQERTQSPLLPSRAIEEPQWIQSSIKSFTGNPGVAVIRGNTLVAFMVTGYRFPFKGQNAVRVPEYCHASVIEDRPELYRLMYMHLAEEWAKEHINLHIVTHFAHDEILKDTLFSLGFGAFLAERLRDLSVIENIPSLDIREEKDPEKLVDLEVEHFQYYRNSPIFLPKNTTKDYRLASLRADLEEGNTVFVLYDEDTPSGLMICGESAKGSGEEGFLLRNTRTAQVKEAYIRESVRERGAGKALLQRVILWAKENGYERLFVEHETANYFGGNFWSGFFTPYEYTSMRYIDPEI